jgi:hypothetical protein
VSGWCGRIGYRFHLSGLHALDILFVHTQSRGNAHLQRRLYQKLFETLASLVYFLMGVRLVALIQGKLLVRIAGRLQGNLWTRMRLLRAGLRMG